MDEVLTFIYTFILKFFILMLIIFAGTYFLSRDTLGDITKHYAEITAVSGGFTSSQYADFINDLKDAGIDTNKATITLKAKDMEGNDVSSDMINVTPTQSKDEGYTDTPKYCPRGTTMTIIVEDDTNSIFSKAFKAFGVDVKLKNSYSKRVYMSERVR